MPGMLKRFCHTAYLFVLVTLISAAPANIAVKPAPIPLFGPDANGKVVIFNGKDFTGWDANEKYWRIENGEIVGQSKEPDHPYDYLCTTRTVKDFRLTLKIKLIPNTENSGIQFRSIRLSRQEMKGPQADVGKTWWGHLYDEHGKGLVTKESGERFVKENDWNTYEIVAVGSRIRTAINGNLCADVDDDTLLKQGVIGLQIHSGGPTEVRFKDIQLELNPQFELKTLKK